MSKIPALGQRPLEEKIVKQALKTFGWDHFKQHLSNIDLNGVSITELCVHIRRSTDFLIKRPDEARERRRSAFVEQLGTFLEQRLGTDAVAQLTAEIAVIQRIEAGYKEILRTLEATEAAKLLADTQAAAVVRRSACSYHDLMTTSHRETRRRKELTWQSFRIKRPDGSSYSPDGVLGRIVNVATMTLMLLGHRYGWFDAQKFLVLPNLPEVTEDEVYKAGSTELLAASWRNWDRMEQRCRYFDGEITVLAGNDLPDWAPQGTETVIEYSHFSEIEILDYFANQRLNDRVIQTFVEMTLQTNIQDSQSGIAKPIGLPPGAFVSAQEAHAGVSLSEILGYPVVDDLERPGGLRLVEWIRGYATLQCLAEESYAEHGMDGLCFTLPRQVLVSMLERVGLKDGNAERFIDQASLRASSRDLFDQPLVRIEDGSLLVFGPGILNSDPARLTLSAIGNQGYQLSRKGQAFERDILAFFESNGFPAKSFKFKQYGKEFEYDVVVPWGQHIFILECKNRTLSGFNPVAGYHFALEMKSAVKQVKRLAAALAEHADAVLQRTGIEVANKTIVPCVLNSLPYATKGDLDGVFVTDASSLKRFFEGRYLNIIRPHRFGDKVTVIHRTAVKEIWKGEKPTSDDLLSNLSDPLQLQMLAGHLRKSHHRFGLSERTVVAVADLTHDEMTTDSLCELFGVNAKKVKRGQKAVTRSLQQAMKNREAHSVREAERAWRLKRLTATKTD